MSLTSVDLPEPETPVTEVSTPSGNDTSISRRLCSRAPTTVSWRLRSTGRRIAGTSMLLLARKIGAGERIRVLQQVLVRSRCARSGRRARRPPGRCRPPSRRARWCPGRARRRSACCRDPAAASGFRSAGGCRADAARSTARRARRARPTRPEPIWVASRMRCASPPDSVPAARDSDRYSSPTSSRKPSRDWISLSTWPAIACSRGAQRQRVEELRRSRRSTARATSAIDFAPCFPADSVTARISGLSRVPSHSGHGTSRMKPS